jgi:hypothetical protein
VGSDRLLASRLAPSVSAERPSELGPEGHEGQEGRAKPQPERKECDGQEESHWRPPTAKCRPKEKGRCCPDRLVVGQFEIRLDSLQLAPFEYDHLFYEPRGSRGERLAVGRYLIGDQGDVLVPFLSDECKNV